MFSELLASPGVEERYLLRSRVGFLALHGGLEAGTAEIAAAAADRAGASLYAVVQPSGLARHVPSHRCDPGSSSCMPEVLDHCEVVLSLHGYGRAGLPTSLLLGGRSRRLAGALAPMLRSALPAYEVIDDLRAIPAELRGLDGRNPVNRSRGGGIQLELPPRVRGLDPGPHRSAARFTPPTEALVGALAGFARSVTS